MYDSYRFAKFIEQARKVYDNYRFAGFTEQARKVIDLAEAEAQRFQHCAIGTEHLILGLVREGECVAAKVLVNLGVELNEGRLIVEALVGGGECFVPDGTLLTPRTKRVIEQAFDEARRLDHHAIGTEHLLLALVNEGHGVGIQVLESLGVNSEQIRLQVLQALNHI